MEYKHAIYNTNEIAQINTMLKTIKPIPKAKKTLIDPKNPTPKRVL